MAKNAIKWHKESYDNSMKTLREKQRRLVQDMDDLKNLRVRLEMYRRQIEEAERRGMEAFDSDRLLKSRGGEKTSKRA